MGRHSLFTFIIIICMGLWLFDLNAQSLPEASTAAIQEPVTSNWVAKSGLPASLPSTAEGVSLRSVQGQVLINRRDQRAISAREGQSLQSHDQIQTGEGASATVDLSGIGEIQIRSNTTWTLNTCVSQEGKIYFSSELTLGELKAKVDKLPKGSAYEVRTPTSVAAIRGTIFEVNVFETQGETYTTLEVEEGTVLFTDPDWEQAYLVEESHYSVASETGDIIPPQEGTLDDVDQTFEELFSEENLSSEEAADETDQTTDESAVEDTEETAEETESSSSESEADGEGEGDDEQLPNDGDNNDDQDDPSEQEVENSPEGEGDFPGQENFDSENSFTDESGSELESDAMNFADEGLIEDFGAFGESSSDENYGDENSGVDGAGSYEATYEDESGYINAGEQEESEG